MNYEIEEIAQAATDWGCVRSATDGTETNQATGQRVAAKYQKLFLLRKSSGGAWQIARYGTSKISPAA